ncbi:hypothetical protein RIF29_00822 [Crotalaria pallida]|uniref:Stigma-specific protein Stig1 n=1 Tax=Crotalaria pallida TaxID=3830 RepID=A0AAN9P7G1_CROPI
MMSIQVQALVIVALLILVQIEENSIPITLHQNGTSVSSSKWLKKVVKGRHFGCHGRAWLCNIRKFPPRYLCCRNRCVNVTFDKNNCGFCGIRCPFNWQCCKGLCMNTNVSVFNCGRCGHRCPLGIFCFFGLCGYGQGFSKSNSPPKSTHSSHSPCSSSTFGKEYI